MSNLCDDERIAPYMAYLEEIRYKANLLDVIIFEGYILPATLEKCKVLLEKMNKED